MHGYLIVVVTGEDLGDEETVAKVTGPYRVSRGVLHDKARLTALHSVPSKPDPGPESSGLFRKRASSSFFAAKTTNRKVKGVKRGSYSRQLATINLDILNNKQWLCSIVAEYQSRPRIFHANRSALEFILEDC